MKKQLIKASTFFGILAMAFLFTACEDDPVEPTPPGGPAGSDFVINKNINTYTVLTNHKAGVDYEICGNINVSAELIIEPGVEIIMCSGTRVTIDQNGSLNAVGTDSLPIIFRGKTAAKGFWELFHFNSNNPNNELNHVIISDAGGSNSFENTSIWVNDNNSGQLTIKNTHITNSKGYGVLVENGASLPNFSKNAFSNNGDAPLKIPISIIGSIDDSTDYAAGNTQNYVLISAATVNQPQEVKNINVPYYLEGPATVKNDLKLNPGVEILMGAGVVIDVQGAGSFNAIGTASDPILIKGKVNSAGFWNVIHINSNNPLNKFSNVTVQNGGSSGSYKYVSIWVNDNNNGSFNMTDCTITDSYSWGLYVENGATMVPSTVEDVENANSFSNNGTGTNASCTGNCNVYFE